MLFRSNRVLAATAALAMAFLPGSAQAGPPGWECSYSVTTIGLGRYGGRTYWYACSGRSLRATRARARSRCRRLHRCITGACIPLSFTPRSYCGRQ